MNNRAYQNKEFKGQLDSKTESLMPKGGKSSSSFVNNRPETVAQRKLQDMASDSANSMQLKALDDMVNNSQQSKQVAQLKIDVKKKIDVKELQAKGAEVKSGSIRKKRTQIKKQKVTDFINKSRDIKHGTLGKTDEESSYDSLTTEATSQPNAALGVSEGAELLATDDPKMEKEEIKRWCESFA